MPWIRATPSADAGVLQTAVAIPTQDQVFPATRWRVSSSNAVQVNAAIGGEGSAEASLTSHVGLSADIKAGAITRGRLGADPLGSAPLGGLIAPSVLASLNAVAALAATVDGASSVEAAPVLSVALAALLDGDASTEASISIPLLLPPGEVAGLGQLAATLDSRRFAELVADTLGAGSLLGVMSVIRGQLVVGGDSGGLVLVGSPGGDSGLASGGTGTTSSGGAGTTSRSGTSRQGIWV